MQSGGRKSIRRYVLPKQAQSRQPIPTMCLACGLRAKDEYRCCFQVQYQVWRFLDGESSLCAETMLLLAVRFVGVSPYKRFGSNT
mmetsp:Transcript_87975/g.152420  ORF Transcript_87975/g.152420 Transcript_87975/m.152420 type:complete len:85 (+) Transcript_87975:569-823(+)